MNIKRLTLGELGTNCYIASKEGTAVVIDPADDADTISDYLVENDLKAVAILLTHGHFDHILACDGLKKMTGATVYVHEAEKGLLESPKLNAGDRFGMSKTAHADVYVKDGQVLDLSGMTFEVIHTPGHTVGSVCYLDKEDKVMFTGDTIFYGSVGRCDLPTGDENVLMKSLQKLKCLDPETEMYPGHGRSTTIAGELKRNMYLR